jgi:hypothetical protein
MAANFERGAPRPGQEYTHVYKDAENRSVASQLGVPRFS